MGMIISPVDKVSEINATICFPVTYGKTRFDSFDVLKQKYNNKEADAIGFFAQCSLYGLECDKLGEEAFDGLFASANSDCADAILFLGRVYEYGMGYLKQDLDAAENLFKYAYSLHNIDALHSLGFLLFEKGKKEIGLSMMSESAELGSRGAKFHLGIMADRIKDVKAMDFYDIQKSEFDYDVDAVKKALTQYYIDLSNEGDIKKAIVEALYEKGLGTYYEIMNIFRAKYLRNRELDCFRSIDFKKLFDQIVKENDDVEMVETSDYAVIDDILYKHLKSGNIKSTVLELDDDDF